MARHCLQYLLEVLVLIPLVPLVSSFPVERASSAIACVVLLPKYAWVEVTMLVLQD